LQRLSSGNAVSLADTAPINLSLPWAGGAR